MPWKIFRDGDRHCVHKEDNGGKGELVACHATHAEAVAQLRALYASESKEITQETLSLLKEIIDDAESEKPERALAVLDEWKARVVVLPDDDNEIKEIDIPNLEAGEQREGNAEEQVANAIAEGKITPEEIVNAPVIDETGEKAKREDVSEADKKRAVGEYGDVAYADEENKKYPIDTEEHIRAAWNYINMPKNAKKYGDGGASIKRKIVAAWKKKINSEGPPAAKKALLERLKEIGDAIVSLFKDEDTDETGITIWKEGNTYWWIARYSNKFRDNDYPPEIISSESHKRFVKLVKEGKAPLPELWIWHNKNWKVGKAHGVAYDDLGFAVAIGTFDVGHEDVAKALMNTKEVARLSHGMPIVSIRRDEVDPTIIVEHETREISYLPAWAAANKLTGFAVLNMESKEESMSIPDETKQEWVKKLGINPETLKSLEDANAADADKAAKEGLESKEVEKTEEAQPAPQTTLAEPPAPEVKEAPAMPTIDELKNAIQETMTGILTPLNERITTLEANIKELKEASDKRDEALKGTPTASLSALISSIAQSAIGAPETRVDGRTSLAQSKPKETAAEVAGRTGIPFIDTMLAGNK